jgi:hypothetical protein
MHPFQSGYEWAIIDNNIIYLKTLNMIPVIILQFLNTCICGLKI